MIDLRAARCRYLIGADNAGDGEDGALTVVGYDATQKPSKGVAGKYINLFDEKNSGAYGPYLHSSDTASQYNEGQCDPAGDGFWRNLSDQLTKAKLQGFMLLGDIDNRDAFKNAITLRAYDQAAAQGFSVICKNPGMSDHDEDSTELLRHSAVIGTIIEKGDVTPAQIDTMRKAAGKPDMPVWFVSFGNGKSWADNVAAQIKAHGLHNMGVTYSSAGEYGSSEDVLVPITDALNVAATPAAPAIGNSDFAHCVKLVLVHEGGNDDDPRDPGGRTSRGIIQTEWTKWRETHPGLPSDVWQAPQDQVEAIYKQQYWDALVCDALPSGVDYAVFDYGVNSGISRSAKLLQELIGVAVDGKIGPATIAAAAQADARTLTNAFCDHRLAFLQGLSTWGTFGHGWATRVAEVRRDALAMVGKPGIAPAPTTIIPPPPKPVPAPGAPELHDLGHQVKAAMLALGNPWFPDQNVVTVETMNPDGSLCETGPNTFDDIKMVLDGTGKIIGGPWEGTSHPGKYWTVHPMASGGAFIIALGPQACWTPGDYHGNTVWRQAGDSTIMGHRDPNVTYKRQGQPIKHGDIGVHHHGGYNLPKSNISNAAAGCQVIRSTSDQAAFMRLTMKCPRYLADPHGYRLTATVLTAAQVLAAQIEAPTLQPAPIPAPQSIPAPIPTPQPAPKPEPIPVADNTLTVSPAPAPKISLTDDQVASLIAGMQKAAQTPAVESILTALVKKITDQVPALAVLSYAALSLFQALSATGVTTTTLSSLLPTAIGTGGALGLLSKINGLLKLVPLK